MTNSTRVFFEFDECTDCSEPGSVKHHTNGLSRVPNPQLIQYTLSPTTRSRAQLRDHKPDSETHRRRWGNFATEAETIPYDISSWKWTGSHETRPKLAGKNKGAWLVGCGLSTVSAVDQVLTGTLTLFQAARKRRCHVQRLGISNPDG